MSNSPATYAKATQLTAVELQRTIAASPQVRQLSQLTLPEIEELSAQIAQVVPAGNIPGLILSGLTRIEGRHVPRSEQVRHIGMLFRGVRNMVDKAVYGAMFAGPAAVIMAYQKLLRLAGKDLDAAFPNGTWQFYLQFALREDTARHANETIGFARSMTSNNIALSDADALTAWVVTCLNTLQNYERLLQNEWRERLYTALLGRLANDAGHTSSAIQQAYASWESIRPYARGKDAGSDDYPAYRYRKFDEYIQPLVATLPIDTQGEFWRTAAEQEQTSLPAYIQQMNILADLVPDVHAEEFQSYRLNEANIAIVFRGVYHIIPVWDAARGRVRDVHTIRQVVAGILGGNASSQGDLDLLLSSVGRAVHPSLWGKSGENEQRSNQLLQRTPIILNWDKRDANLPLAAIRQGRRGIGNHALTLLFTDESTVFDQSHIFFDGAWGAALAEIMTNEALSWAYYLNQRPPTPVVVAQPIQLSLHVNSAVQEIAQRERLPDEAYAESTAIRLGMTLALRRLFKSRSDLIAVTVNDLLILYRSICGQRYTPSLMLQSHLDALRTSSDSQTQAVYAAILEAIERVQRSNPSILIPMDASQLSPRERLYPTTFRNPMSDLLQWHDSTLSALRAYQNAQGDRRALYNEFDERQRTYLSMLASFGVLMRKYKDIALSGQSTSTATIRLLAFMPDSVKRLLDQIPSRFDVLNEVIKGEEVFSNVGRVARGSSLRRFITAKDDNQQKTLAWGVVTDDADVVRLSLRDFRPHVTMLHSMGNKTGMKPLADLIAQDFLDAYADGYNLFIRELRDITLASRETKSKDEKDLHA
jgi:hypothetical protein